MCYRNTKPEYYNLEYFWQEILSGKENGLNMNLYLINLILADMLESCITIWSLLLML